MKTDFLQQLTKIFIKHISLIRRNKQILHIPEQKKLYCGEGNGWHFHPSAEIFIQLSGISRMHTLSENIMCSCNEIMIIPKGVTHHEEIYPATSKFKNVVIAFGRETVSMHVATEDNNRKIKIIEMEQFAPDNVSDINKYLDNIVLWMQDNSSPHYRNAAQGMLLTVFNLLLNNIEHPAIYRRDESYKVAQCRRLVSEHLANPDLNVQWLANKINCVPDYLSNIFHRETGNTLITYVNDKRIDFAKELLLTSNLNISEIAHACGYRDPGYMTRQFKKRFSVSPRHYRAT